MCVSVDLCYQEDTRFLQQPSISAHRMCENLKHVLLHSCRGPEGTSYCTARANEALYDVARKTYLQISSWAPGVQLE